MPKKTNKTQRKKRNTRNTKPPAKKRPTTKKTRTPKRKTRKSTKRKQQRALLLKLARYGFLAGIWGCIALLALLLYYIHDIPSTKKLSEETRSHSIRILSADHQLIAQIGSTYGSELQYEDFPQSLINAVIATEDRRFFRHSGVDIIGLARAMWVNIQAGRIVQGGSTLTQQLAKIVFLSPERTIKRKVQELLLALWLEHNFSKEELITLYLNRVYLGSGYYGVDAAARGYFGKKAGALNLGESALLAGLLKAPSRYSPHSNIDLAEKRTTQILINMIDTGYITVGDATKATLKVKAKEKRNRGAHYFADWIREQIPDYVGIVDSDLTVITTLDWQLQQFAERTLRDTLTQVGDKMQASQAALIAMSPQGEIVTMVGGRDYAKSQFNRATQAQRQPGSAFKLFVYLAALEAGYTPTDVLDDEEITIDGWTPRNYHGEYEGKMTVKDAFAHSVNTIAVKLSENAGRNNVVHTARRLGVESSLHTNPSIALGSSEVNLMELTQAYAHLANNGFIVRHYGIKEIRTIAGETLYKRQGSYSERVLSRRIVPYMNRLLVAVMQNGTGRYVRLLRESAGKSGTSQGFRDAWFVGFTPQIVTGVWVGNDDNSPMDGVTGNKIPGRIWQQFMRRALHNTAPQAIPIHRNPFWSLFGGKEEKDYEEQRERFWEHIAEEAEEIE